MKVSVVIPAYNEEAYLAECLQSIVDQEEPADEIIVVDNNSTDNTMKLAKSFGARVVRETQQGMIPARNRGFDEAQYEIIARTDADTRVPSDWIKRIKTAFSKDSELVALSGPASFYNMELFSFAGDVSHLPSQVSFQTFSRTIRHGFVYGPNMALRKSAWLLVRDEVCLEDKDVHEDIDLSLHIAQYGKILFDKKLLVSSSFRRWKKLTPYFEYPYRVVKTIRRHKKTILETQSKRLAKQVYLRSKTFVKHIQQFPN